MDYTTADLLEAKRQIDSTLHKLRQTIQTLQAKENPERYKSQITLAVRRVRAFEIANALIEKELAAGEEEEEKGSDLSMGEMLEMQRALQERYKDRWEPVGPEAGKHKLLWMVGEIGEVADIIKKNGEARSLEDADLRKHLVEEMADVLMYYNDILLCYGIGEEELKQAYRTKFQRNLMRW